MKTYLAAAALLALWLAAPAGARANGPPLSFCFPWLPYRIEAGGNLYLRAVPHGAYGGGPQAGPWYLYWPLEAHFQRPALPQYPYWPAPQTLPPSFGAGRPGAAPGHYPH